MAQPSVKGVTKITRPALGEIKDLAHSHISNHLSDCTDRCPPSQARRVGATGLSVIPAKACPESSQEQEYKLSDWEEFREKETNSYG